MTAWITQQQAADLLGCHVSLIGKLVARGDLTSRGREGRASLDRDQVIGLRGLREQRERDRQARRRPRMGRMDPPDEVHLWLTTAQVAELVGISVVAVNKRCRRERLPYVDKAGRRWIRWDLLEQVEPAHEAQQIRRLVRAEGRRMSSMRDGDASAETPATRCSAQMW